LNSATLQPERSRLKEDGTAQLPQPAIAKEILLCAKRKDMSALEELLHPEMDKNVDAGLLLTRLGSQFAGEPEQYHGLLQRLVISARPTLALIGSFFASAERLGALDAAERLARRRIEQTPDFFETWGEGEYLGQYRTAPEAMRILAELKYGPAIADPERDLPSLAYRGAERLKIRPELSDNLFANSRLALPRPYWNGRLKLAFALEHLIADRRFIEVTLDRIRSCVAMDRWANVVNSIKATPRAVCITFHGAQIAALRALYAQQNGWITLQANDARRPDLIGASGDSGTALFSLFREVQNGKPVLIAPDARFGKRLQPFTILGTQFSAGEGAAFTAYHARADLSWLHMELQGEHLVPVCVQGPPVGDGENYESYKERWNEFYAAQIEQIVTGKPDGIALRQPWIRVLSSPAQGH
jgi:hypothetical protein